MNSTGQNLGVNPLMGTPDTALTTDAAKSVSAPPSEDKSLKDKGFSDYMEGQKDAGKGVTNGPVKESVEEVTPVEAANSGVGITTAPPTPKTYFAAEGGSSLPADGSPLPSGETVKVASPGVVASAASVVTTVADGQGSNQASVQQAPVVTATETTSSQNKSTEAGPVNNEPTLTAKAAPGSPDLATNNPPVSAPSPEANPVAAAAPLADTRGDRAIADTATAKSAAITPVSGEGRAATTTATGQTAIATPVPTQSSTTETALAESSNVNKAATVSSSLQESPLGLRIKPQMANNPSGIATIENPFVEPKESATPTPLNTSISAEAPTAYRSYSESGLQTAVSVPVGKPGWSESVMQRVMWMSSQNISKAEIALDPPELGPMNVKISSSGDQTSVVFTSNHGAVRDALDQGLPRLREMMENQGVNLSDVDVSDQSASQERQQTEAEGAATESESELADEGLESSSDEAVAISKPLSLVDQYV